MQDLSQAPLPAADDSSSRGANVAALVILLGILVPVIWSNWYLPVDSGAAFDAVLRHVVALLVISTTLVLVIARRRSESWRVIVVNSSVFAVGLLFMLTPLVQLINGVLDGSSGRVHRVAVHGHRQFQHRAYNEYRVVVQSWRKPGSVETLRVSRHFYDAVKSGARQVDVTTKEGYLGIEWVDGFAAVAR